MSLCFLLPLLNAKVLYLPSVINIIELRLDKVTPEKFALVPRCCNAPCNSFKKCNFVNSPLQSQNPECYSITYRKKRIYPKENKSV